MAGLLAAGLGSVLLLLAACAARQPETGKAAAQPASGEPKPIDWRYPMPASMLQKVEEGVWESPVVKAKFPFDEMIYSWSALLPEQEGFRVYLKVGFGDGEESPWLYAGFWGFVKNPVKGRTNPTFDRGMIDMDQVLLKAKATTFQFRIVDEGKTSLGVLPSLMVITTDNKPTAELANRFRPFYPGIDRGSKVLDIPFRRQADSKENPTPARCQSAALASALEYFGKAIALEDIIAYTNDPEYDYPGIWPRVTGTAVQLGFDAYLDRFRDWDAVWATLKQNKVILCSIKMPEGEYIAPPYPTIGGHIVVLNGLTDDGRVVVTDSALAKSGRGVRCQWIRKDFEKVWMKIKGGVGMVICPPPGFQERLVTDLPPFPADRMEGKPVDLEKEL